MSSDSRSRSPIDPQLVRELADILRETELSEIEVEHDDLRLRIARQLTAAPAVQTVSVPAAAPAPAQAAAAPGAAPAAAEAAEKAGTVKSPMVGGGLRRLLEVTVAKPSACAGVQVTQQR